MVRFSAELRLKLFSNRGPHHVHESNVPRIRRVRLPVPSNGVRRGRDPFHGEASRGVATMLGVQEPAGDPQRGTGAPVSGSSHRESAGVDRAEGTPAGVQGVRGGAAGGGVVRTGPAWLHEAVWALRGGAGPAHDDVGRNAASGCELESGEGAVEAGAPPAIPTALPEGPPGSGDRRDLDREGTPVPDRGAGSGERRGGVHRRGEGSRRTGSVLEAPTQVGGADRSGGHRHVTGLHQRGRHAPAGGHGGVRPVPRGEADE